MEIGLYIAELLSEQDEVSVPGLGTFIKVRVAGSYDKLSNLFYPPAYHLSLREGESSHSGLSQYISTKKNLSNSSSEGLIKKFTSNILELLNSSDSVEIRHLGIIHKKNGRLSFIPAEDFVTKDDFYGLKAISERKKGDSIPVQVKSKEIVPENIEEVEEEEEAYAEEVPKPRLIPVLIISILAIIATLAALFYFDKGFNHFVKSFISAKEQSVKISEPIKDTITASAALTDTSASPVNSLSPAKDTIVQKTKSTEKTLETTLPKPEQTASVKEEITFEIIVAAFSRKSDAETYIKEVEKKGIKAKVVENMPGKMLKISLGTFTDEESATKELNRIHKEINKDAWIARVKPLKNP
ncbi:MAG: SPOR domain-containing protein [Pedobacter sp.]|jgi:cell division septation protein DedD